MKEKNNFVYHDNDTPEEHEKDLNKEYWFSLTPFVLLIFLASVAAILYIN